MTKVHFVKKAAKDNSAVKKGQPYYWWKFMVGGRGGPKHFSATRPRASQLTQSEFLGAVYGAQEDLEDACSELKQGKITLATFVDRVSDVKSAVEEAGEECENKLSNMPDSLQQGPSGETLQERIDACATLVQELEQVYDEIKDMLPVEHDEAKKAERAVELVEGVSWEW